MLAVNAAVLIGVFLHKISLPPFVPYIHLLVDYHFGFTKRALIGAAVALFTAKVPVWLVFALAGAAWLLTLGLFVQLFRRTFGLDAKHLPLFLFMAGSPFFLKNFMHTLGHFDIYGCLFTIGLLLSAARSFPLSRPVGGAGIDRPRADPPRPFPGEYAAVAAIVVLRYYLPHGLTVKNLTAGFAALAVTGSLFIAMQFYGTVEVPQQTFTDYLQSRMADPSRTDLLSFAYIWYQPLSKEIADTWARLPHNMLGVPVFALLIWLHTPLWRYFAGLIVALRGDMRRRIVIAALALITAGYVLMFAIVFDYSRWVSNWAVCMFLILHAVKSLPASRETPLIRSDDTKTTIFGAIVTLIPRVGIVRPF